MYGQFGIPGQTAAYSTVDNEFIWGGSANQVEILATGGIISSAARDAGASPTTKLRKGLLLGKISASGKLVQWNPTATDGSQDVFGVLQAELSMVDLLGNAQDRQAPVVVKAPLRARNLYAVGLAFVGSDGEYIARKQLVQMGCKFDDDFGNVLAGLGTKYESKAASYTVVAADSGKTFLATTADTTFTLPAIKEGMTFEFIRTDDFELIVASAAGDDIIVGGDAAADSITFTTASQQIGARIRVTAIRVGASVKWLAELPHTPYGTGLATMAYAIAT
jgi:hypothetical protein